MQGLPGGNLLVARIKPCPWREGGIVQDSFLCLCMKYQKSSLVGPGKPESVWGANLGDPEDEAAGDKKREGLP